MTHPLHRVAEHSTRERVRKAIGPCAGLDPERHADLITAAVLRKRVPDAPHLTADLNARARRIAGQRKRDGLVSEGSIA